MFRDGSNFFNTIANFSLTIRNRIFTRQFKIGMIVQVSRKKIALTNAIQTADSQAAVMNVFLRNRCCFDNVHLSKSFKKLAKLPNEALLINNPIFKDMCKLTETRLQVMSTRSIEEITYSILNLVTSCRGKLPLVYGSLSTIVFDTVTERMKEFKCAQLACICYCFHRMNNSILNVTFLNKVSDHLQNQVLECTKVWPIMHLYLVYCSRSETYSINDNLKKRLIYLIPQFTIYQTAFILSAIAKLDFCNDNTDRLIERFIHHSIPILDKCNLHDLSDLTWSLAKLEYPRKDVVEAYLGYAIKGLSSGTVNSKYFAKLAWSFAKLGITDHKIYALISRQILSNYNRDIPIRHLINTAWAFATGGFLDLVCYDNISNKLFRKADKMNEQDISNITWAFALTGYRNEKLQNKVADTVIGLIHHINSSNLSTITWGFAILRCSNYHLFDIIAAETIKRIKSTNSSFSRFQPGHLLLLVWSLIVANVFSQILIRIVLHPIFVEHYLKGANKLQQCQLYQIHMAAKLKAIEVGGGLIPNHLYHLYGNLLYNHDKRHTYVAIEADGPSHFSCNQPYVNLGQTVLKQRHLKQMGFAFAQIAYHEWMTLNNKDEKISYLLEKIDAAL
ncbi:uncharacterized protein TRIADDRAFT_52413 [Trichoplax adhaerens]|uniref:RAP domain-containing protein n=1 Tax=Trichoplax adhaerens TaxID=10228 RepID=B3RIB3_TRIAD|nr:hypothetical protein TRIADDRAFT_52413 [Trichoplax adhaerens]EDV28989.1 hypothetical protein TRIADDRAFT_52413 [Trichoplax adhaerens]|eukprot:XP_002108191.1 hypothetical protein TRIADDRAFT_52413 [Trichoplax adhaerens]